MRRCDVLRQIVDHPVRDIFDAVEAQQIEGFLGFGQPRAFPRSRRFAGEFSDRLDRPLDRIGLVLELVHRTLNESMAHELKTGFEGGGSNAWI